MRISIELTDEDYERLTAWAKAEHRSRTAQAAKVILDALDRRDHPVQVPAVRPYTVINTVETPNV